MDHHIPIGLHTVLHGGPATERELHVSLLGIRGGSADDDAPQPPWFYDLALDRLIAAVTVGRENYDLAPLFHRPLGKTAAVLYRQDVVRDLGSDATTQACEAFAEAMRRSRDHFARADARFDDLQKQRVRLEGLAAYCAGVHSFAAALTRCPLASRGFIGLRDHLFRYASGEAFLALDREVKALVPALAEIRYDVRVYGGGLRVERHAGGRDYGAEVEALFAKFQQDATMRRPPSAGEPPDLNQVEARILDFVARLYPALFGRLAAVAAKASDAIDPTLRRIDREIQFYLAYLGVIAPLREAGLPFCLPTPTTGKAVSSRDGFDLMLAVKLVGEHRPVVTNSFRLDGDERMIVVSGPNQGGKTTFARAFGQMHHLASLGLPVPGREATLHVFDAIHTHFEREERVADRRGKLEDDLVRIHAILEAATPDSIIVLNEIFSSTTLEDAVFLAGEVVKRIVALDALCVLVSFIDELAALSPTIVSAVSTIIPEDPSRRTFEIVRRPADGRSYALSIAEKHRLTTAALAERLRF